MSMFKHIPSKDDLDILINDEGFLFIFCKNQNKLWTGQLHVQDISETSTNNITSGRVISDELLNYSKDFTSLQDFGINLK